MEANPNWVQVTVNGRVVRGALSWDLRSSRRPLILVSARAQSPSRLLSNHQLHDYRRFEQLIRTSTAKRAIATAKRAAYRVATAEGVDVIRHATLTVMQFGVVPVFVRDESCEALIDGQPQSAHVAIYPQYGSYKTDDRQLSFDVGPGKERSENFYIARMLQDHLDDCIEKYSIDVSRHFSRIVQQSSYVDIFLQIKMIREVLTQSLRSKLDTIRAGLSGRNDPDADRAEIRKIYADLSNAVIRIEVFLLAIDELLDAFYGVLGLHIESPTVTRRNASRQTHRIQDAIVSKWGQLLDLTCEDVEHLLGHDLAIAGLKALLDHIRLGTTLENPSVNLPWLSPYYEFARRVRFLKVKAVHLHELNVFLSKRTANNDVFGSMFGAPDGAPTYRVHEYFRDTPPANDLYDEIDWLVWACYGFLSIMEHGAHTGPNDNLAWLIRELDLALSYRRVPNVSIVRSNALPIARLKEFARDDSVWLFRRPHIQEQDRRTVLAEQIERLLHIVHDDAQLGNNSEELRKIVQTIQKFMREMYVRFAGDFLIGWASIFSGNTLKALEAIYSPKGRALSSAKVHNVIKIGKGTSLRDIAKNVTKYQVVLRGKPFSILSVVERAGQCGSRPLALEPSLAQSIPLMFPGAPVDQVLEKFAAGLPHLFSPEE